VDNIYQRFNTQNTPPGQKHSQTQSPNHARQQNRPPSNSSSNQHSNPHQRSENKSTQNHTANHQQSQSRTSKQQQTHKPPSKINLKDLLGGFVPTSVYNPQTKKILGIFTSEDLMLVALILLLLENKDEDNQLLIVALCYVLLSDYIDFSSLGGILG